MEKVRACAVERCCARRGTRAVFREMDDDLCDALRMIFDNPSVSLNTVRSQVAVTGNAGEIQSR